MEKIIAIQFQILTYLGVDKYRTYIDSKLLSISHIKSYLRLRQCLSFYIFIIYLVAFSVTTGLSLILNSVYFTILMGLSSMCMAAYLLIAYQNTKEELEGCEQGIATEGVNESFYYKKSHNQRSYYHHLSIYLGNNALISSGIALIIGATLCTQGLYESGLVSTGFTLGSYHSQFFLWLSWIIAISIEALDLFDILVALEISLQPISYQGFLVSTGVFTYKLIIDVLLLIQIKNLVSNVLDARGLAISLLTEPHEIDRQAIAKALTKLGGWGERAILKELKKSKKEDSFIQKLSRSMSYFTSYATLSSIPQLQQYIIKLKSHENYVEFHRNLLLATNVSWPVFAPFIDHSLYMKSYHDKEVVCKGSLQWSFNKIPVATSGSLHVGTTPVTQDLWFSVMKTDPSYFVGPRRPVESINLVEAVLFCNALSEALSLNPFYQVSIALNSGDDDMDEKLLTNIRWRDQKITAEGIPTDLPVSFLRTLKYSDLTPHKNPQLTKDGLLMRNQRNKPIFYHRGGHIIISENSESVDPVGFRLPTKTEWKEIAIYHGKSQDMMSDSHVPYPMIWTKENANAQSLPLVTKQTYSILHDVLGNVSEWCWERQDNNLKRSYYMGGNWFQIHQYASIEHENTNIWNYISNQVGFRIVKG